MPKKRIRVGITMGDPSGIGQEIIAKAIPQVIGLAEFAIIGDKWAFGQAIGHRPNPACQQAGTIGFIDLKNVKHKSFRFGAVSAEYGKASLEYLDKALELIRRKQIDCLVTCPISKEAISKAGYEFSGHTEYFIRRIHRKDVAMMLLNQKLKFSLITRHIPLKEITSRLNKGIIKMNIRLTYNSLKSLFGISNPRIAVCGLNPHASDNGTIGDEENTIVKPALNALRKQIKDLDGPISADSAIKKAAENKYDCIIAMYHDQALIPLKLTSPQTGVNLTLGLPFIRTSPLHGTAFDIAGQNKATPLSFIEAIKLAVRCAVNQKKA